MYVGVKKLAFCDMVLLLRGMAWGILGVLCGERGLHR